MSVTDLSTGTSFLVDTGAEISVFPASKEDRSQNSVSAPLSAVNGTTIQTWGNRDLTLNFGDKERYTQKFYLADVSRPILGADFIINNGLVVDLKGKRLISPSKFSVLLTSSDNPSPVSGLSTAPHNQYSELLLKKYSDILTPSFDSDSNKHGVEHHIVTTGPPVHAHARRLDPEKLEAAKAEFKRMEQMGIIRRSNSAWSSPLHMVRKSDNSWRPCGDYRQVNNATVDDRYPLPHIQDFNNKLAGCKVFSKIDLIRGYHQIPMEDNSIAKTAIITPFGLWEFVRMPFGLKNAAQTFQRLMDDVLREVPCSFVYIDDILLASHSHTEHAQHLEQLFQTLSDNGLAINKAKCVFGAEELDFLGHRITQRGITPLPGRIQALRDYEAPSDRSSLQRFLGMLNYYHRFLPNIAMAIEPLHKQASGKGQAIDWSTECQKAFETAKDALGNAILLHHPRADAPTSLTVDASDKGMGATLEQRHGRVWVPLAFFSRKLSEAEKKYSAFDKELLAAYVATKHFRYFLEGRHFTLYTDHKPLTSAINSQADRSPRQTRHLSYIAEFTSDIQHVKGKFNVVADALSRINSVSHSVEAFEEDISKQNLSELAKEQINSKEMDLYLVEDTGLELRLLDIDGTKVWCDVSTGRARPILPSSWTRKIFDSIHGLSHAGPKPTQVSISQRFVWRDMKRQIRLWCKECHACQASKITRHTRAPLSERCPPTRRFGSLHVDLVGPLPESNGMIYLLTIIDRFTKWPEAIPLPDSQASTCASAILHHWISKYGIPEDITSDRGPQFTSRLWQEFNRLLGVQCHNTTAYHPQANGLVERFHRQLKSALKARMAGSNWYDNLPIVLLGIRSSWRVNPGCAPAELVYGTTLRLPGEMFLTADARTFEPEDSFLRRIQNTMRNMRPSLTVCNNTHTPFIPKELSSTGYVYVRHDAQRHPLQRPYDGPFKILEQGEKYYVLDLNGRKDRVSIDRLKPAYINQEDMVLPCPATRRGRTVRPPDRLDL